MLRTQVCEPRGTETLTPTGGQQGLLTETARTDAHPAADIDRHSGGALAEEGARRVDAFAVDADSGEDLTLVHVWQRRPKGSLTLLQGRVASG